MPPSVPREPAQRSRAVLDLCHRWLTAPPGVEAGVAELARAFGARGAGLAVPGFPLPRVVATASGGGQGCGTPPWGGRPGLVEQLRQTPGVQEVRTDKGETFHAAAIATGFVWLEAGADSGWGTADAAALELAGYALGKALSGAGRTPDQARQHQRLEEAAVVIGRVAHDFGNVLTGILGFTELSLNETAPNTTVHHFVTEIFQAAQEGVRLTSNLRSFSQRAASCAHPTALAPALADVQARVRAEWGEAVTLEVSLPGDLPPVRLTGDPLRHLLAHLLDNAREAVPDRGTVTVGAAYCALTEADCPALLGEPRPGPFVELTVADSGPGFTPEARRRGLHDLVFSTKPRHRGLGLPAVYGILRAHGGGLRLDSAPEGGALVRAYLPAAGPPPTKTGAEGVRERVLVVDDDPLTLDIMCATLRRAGYRVQAASDGPQALDSFTRAAEPFNLVLSDVVMPRMTGFDLARRLLVRHPHVNVLFTSGHVPPGGPREDFSGRDFELLPKPFRPDGLLRAVRSALDRGAPGPAPTPPAANPNVWA
jgi:signal transduction histidine kinase/CheY-like chemotaxis protein